jgi:hypothetical protein
LSITTELSYFRRVSTRWLRRLTIRRSTPVVVTTLGDVAQLLARDYPWARRSSKALVAGEQPRLAADQPWRGAVG